MELHLIQAFSSVMKLPVVFLHQFSITGYSLLQKCNIYIIHELYVIKNELEHALLSLTRFAWLKQGETNVTWPDAGF